MASHPVTSGAEAETSVDNGFSDPKAAGPEPGTNDTSQADAFQRGVQRVRAMTTVWSRWTLACTLVLLYLVAFVDMLQNYIDSSLNPYITSSFGRHGLLNLGKILAGIIGGCAPLALAKAVDLWGRVEGFLVMLVVCLAGIVAKAACRNVETYVAAHVLYWTGHIGMTYVLGVLVADTTSLRNRLIVVGINYTPRIASTFGGPAIAQLFYTRSSFRWAFGAFAIILAACSAPAMGLMTFVMHGASKHAALGRQRASSRTLCQSAKHYSVQLDLCGMLLLMAALSCVLLPFSLVGYAPRGWSTPYVVVIEVLGVVFLALFYLWETRFAPVQFLPFKFLRNGTIVGSCLLTGFMYLSTFCWNGYFNSYLQVVHRLSITNAGYILNAYGLTSSVAAPLVGALVSWTGNFKWPALCGVPIMLLGTALLIPFRSPGTAPGMLAMTQVLVGLGASFVSMGGSLAVLVPVTHQEIAAVTALYGLFGGVGASMGHAVAGGFWNGMLPSELRSRLPERLKNQSEAIFGDMVLQMSFADGTPEREAVVGAYGHVMTLMMIAGASFMPPCLLFIMWWKKVNVKKLEEERGTQTKGVVF